MDSTGERQLYIVDAFTDTPFSGNAAGVVPEADGLGEKRMLQIAAELKQSETAFLALSNHPDADFRVRYFTPQEEIDFCGHATVAAAWVLGSEYGWAEKAERVVFETNIGLVPVDLLKEDDRLKLVTMTQVAPKLQEIDVTTEEIARLAGISPSDVDPRSPIKLGYTGNWHLLLPVKTREAIDVARPLLPELAAMNRRFRISTTHLFTFDTQDDNYDLYTRDFAPAVGIPEDPVTGAANGALAGYLLLEGIISADSRRLRIAQGHAIGRPGTLFVTVTPGERAPVIQVAGSAHISIKGTLNNAK
ncbi:PhzF family phenazine biosynthesis protein [Paenibacillus beijingensis]|uniref:PhzF family phenazine biosynthesis protein n=1 Tax=Paenibacillus beijingensis TaxID=1126833 RepID=A0A0D5NGG0_9BACL|nr:PhzF family phenazine biosynthesis protein [Paenibacillus beijingensis]AJY74003.1 PhzF family phenazine biosynthesis protein [Paenibacillus beijingensis]